MAMRKFLDDAEIRSRQGVCSSQGTKKETGEGNAECKEEDPVEDEDKKEGSTVTDELQQDKGRRTSGRDLVQIEVEKEVLRAFRILFNGFEEQWHNTMPPESVDSESEAEESLQNPIVRAVEMQTPLNEESEDWIPDKEPQLYLCDDWIQPVMVARKPRSMTAKETMRANVAKNCLILTMMSLELGYGSIIERSQQARDAVERYQQRSSETPVYLDSVILTDEEVSARASDQHDEIAHSSAVPAIMPPSTRLAGSAQRKVESQVHAVAPKDSSLKLYHVMSVNQTLREDLAECAYQFSCRAADWSRSDLHVVPMQFEPLELHVIDALGQQEVPDYFQQPAKAITEDVSVMRGPYAQGWIAAVLEEIESFKRLGVYEEVPKGSATSPPLPARLILVTKPNIHGGPARKKARIVICGNFQDVYCLENPQLPCIKDGLVSGITHGMASGMLGRLDSVSLRTPIRRQRHRPGW